ncbi:MAG TPA: TetR/AcrR family transcriptional regulator [Dongiaceae bacterium]|nr:TetR/AcrR family transcriptional regulator [Dongiaceae bacterium]
MTSRTSKKSPARTYGGLSEAERVVERRERFLEAGLEVFGTVGLRGATVRALCKTAGLTERYFYESFADTEALFCAVYERQTAVIREIVMKEVPQMPQALDARTYASIDMFFTLMRNERVVRILHIESMSGSENVRNLHQTGTRLAADMSALLIRSDYPELKISDEFLFSLAMAFNGVSNAMVVQWMLGGYTTPQDILVKTCAVMVRGAIRELRDEQKKSK